MTAAAADPAGTPPAGVRVPSLDGVRGIAILLVLATHFFLPYARSPVSAALRQVLGYGWLGVDLFFVLSGFLITGVLLRARDDPHYFRNFYARRVLRIFPAYYFVLTVVFFVYPLFNPVLQEAHLSADAPWYYAHLQNWLWITRHEGPGWYGVSHFWSLAVEEQFYLVWPFLLWRTPTQALGRICLLIIGLSITCKLVLWRAHADHLAVHLGTITRFDALGAGAWVAVQRHAGREPGRVVRAVIAAASLVLLGFVAFRSGTSPTGATTDLRVVIPTTTAAAIAFAGFVWHAAGAGAGTVAGRVLRSRPLLFLGKYSYGIYLIHLVLHPQLAEALRAWFMQWFGFPSNLERAASALVLMGLTLALAVSMYHLLEAPALRLKERFSPHPVPQR